ncbi:MAG: hypothetical protein HZB39_19850 [Planctomycetes bacterium]|nr:hypothetical protein [Planctomycetota bacterium]
MRHVDETHATNFLDPYMSIMVRTRNLTTGVILLALGLSVAACGGGKGGGGTGPQTQGAKLLAAYYGRLVDLYAFRRIDPAVADRRVTSNREPVLITRNIVISPQIETEALVDSVGNVRPGASFRFMPFDVTVGHEELLILWDDLNEKPAFDEAMGRARSGLIEVSPAYRDQNILTNPIPVMPRNAALELRFDRNLGLTNDFFVVNPSAIQILRFRDDPNVVPAPVAFEPATVRLLTDGGSTIIVDTTLIGGETSLSRTTSGLAQSLDSVTANYRVAIPTSGIASRSFSVRPDSVAQLNGVDANGDPAAIRDFRSGNIGDGRVGALEDFERPQIITQKRVGITAIDASQRVLTLTKRGANVAVRGRLPFVDGIVDRNTSLPKGPSDVPTVDENGTPLPLPAGDFVVQDVISPVTGERVRIRAEVLQVLEVGTIEGDGNFAGPGLTVTGTDGGELPTINVRVSTVQGSDSRGNRVTFEAAVNGGAGADCDVTVRYYEFLRYSQNAGAGSVTDADRRAEFALVDPEPGNPGAGTGVQPDATFGFRFSEPMDVQAVSPLDNFVLANQECHVGVFPAVLASAKSASLNFVFSRLIDRRGDGTLLELAPPAGLFHQQGQTEQYWVHVDVASNGVRDLAGNRLDLFDRRTPGTITVGGNSVEVPLRNFSQRFDLEPTSADNWVGSRVFRFAAADEDGTRPGSIDFFGQFQLDNGSLRAASVTRRSRTADGANLGSIERWNRGECVAPEVPAQVGPPPVPRVPPQSFRPGSPSYGNGVLYRTPSMNTVQPGPPLIFQPPQGPQPFGGIVEPHTAFGARVQMTYREDDFGMSHSDVGDLNIDVEQMHWAPWADSVVLYDSFDRYTMKMSHSKKRPDLLFKKVISPMGDTCGLDCGSLFSGITTNFADNVLENSTSTEVIKDQSYVINPNSAFRAASTIKYVPYPTFRRTYTWRDSRIVTWDRANDRAVGLGGSLNAVDAPPLRSTTASCSSPWVRDNPDTALLYIGGNRAGWLYDTLVRDVGDFNGNRTRDHDPIALPLLIDVSVWPDDTRAVANAGNLFHIAYVGPMWSPINPGGYYNAGGGITTIPAPAGPDPYSCSGIDWPFFRVYSFGGPDPNNPSIFTRLDPDRALTAQGGVIKDLGLGDPIAGLYRTKPGDDHVPWAQIDLVRKVSIVTFGFFDTLQPNRHDLATQNPALPALPATTGRPNLSTLAGGDVRVQDIMAILDPPPAQQPGGTRIDVEYRGLRTLTRPDPYDPITNDAVDARRNLLNPNYACDAYRYAMTNPSSDTAEGTTPRVVAQGLTPYVKEGELDTIRDPANLLLPRYMNFRLVMENNIASNPTQAPALRGMGLVFRIARTN